MLAPLKQQFRAAVTPLSLDVRFDDSTSLDSPTPLPLPTTSSTPVHAKFRTTDLGDVPPAPLLVAQIPRTKKSSDGLSFTPPALSPPPPPPMPPLTSTATPPTTVITDSNSIPFPSSAPDSSPRPAVPSSSTVVGGGSERPNASSATSSSSKHQDVEGDGPLFRAVVASLSTRAKALRAHLKQLVRVGGESLEALAARIKADDVLDDSLAALSLGSSTDSTSLGGIFDGKLKRKREERRIETAEEERLLIELVDRLKGAVDRLKSLEGRRRSFEADAKKYYEDLGKYLARTEPDINADAKQRNRTASFEQTRVEYHAFAQGLVESEEAAVASWLKLWARVVDDEVDPAAKVTASEEFRRESKEHQQFEAVINGEVVDFGGVETDGGALSDDGGSASAPGGSGPSAAAVRRRRRSSIPAAFGSGAEKGEGTRDRIKGFIKKTSDKINAMPSSYSSSTLSTDALRSPPLARAPSPKLSAPASRPGVAPHGRRKEGLLFSTSKNTSHSSTGDGGGQWTPHYCVLSEGKFVEFSDWRTLRTKNPPINLSFASARVSHNTERRFCFEILTPSSRRIYQATTEAERNEWIKALQNSIESLLNGTSSVRHFDASRLTGESTPYSLHDFGSTTSLARTPMLGLGNSDPSSSSSRPLSTASTNPVGRLLARRSSVKTSSANPPPSSSNSLLPERRSSRQYASPSPSRQGKGHHSALSEGGIPSSTSPPMSLTAASLSLSPPPRTTSLAALGPASPRSRSLSGSSHSSSNSIFDDDEREESSACSHDREIRKVVSGWASSSPNSSTLSTEQHKMRNAQIIREFAAEEGNNACADCGTEDPRWASWSLGITLCIRCSGVHRSLGTHVSKVRSVELDDWTDEQIAAMRSWGNLRANAYWEAHKPATVVATDSNISEFIRRKYADKDWAGLAASPPTPASSSSSRPTSQTLVPGMSPIPESRPTSLVA